MCRVNIARAPQPAEAGVNNADALMGRNDELNFAELFSGEVLDNGEFEADLQFLEIFNATQVAQEAQAAPAINAVLGQPIDAEMKPLMYPTAALGLLPSMQPQQQQQMQALAQQQAQSQPVFAAAPPSVAGPPPASTLQQHYTQAILQQHMLAQLQAEQHCASMPVSKRGKTASEIAEQQERIKRRRRESAQRSRQRKSAYMKTLECENHALKVEVDRLRRELACSTGRPMPPAFASALTTSGSSAGLDEDHPSTEPGAMHESSGGPFTAPQSSNGLEGQMVLPATHKLMGMVL